MEAAWAQGGVLSAGGLVGLHPHEHEAPARNSAELSPALAAREAEVADVLASVGVVEAEAALKPATEDLGTHSSRPQRQANRNKEFATTSTSAKVMAKDISEANSPSAPPASVPELAAEPVEKPKQKNKNQGPPFVHTSGAPSAAAPLEVPKFRDKPGSSLDAVGVLSSGGFAGLHPQDQEASARSSVELSPALPLVQAENAQVLASVGVVEAEPALKLATEAVGTREEKRLTELQAALEHARRQQASAAVNTAEAKDALERAAEDLPGRWRK